MLHSKKRRAQKNELGLKVLTYNLSSIGEIASLIRVACQALSHSVHSFAMSGHSAEQNDFVPFS